MDKYARHIEICDELNDVYVRKNKDYGNSFGNMFQKLGIISAITRIGDKYYRLENLCTKSDDERLVPDESIIDTLKDMANYAIMSLIELEIQNEKRND